MVLYTTQHKFSCMRGILTGSPRAFECILVGPPIPDVASPSCTDPSGESERVDERSTRRYWLGKDRVSTVNRIA